MNEEQEKTEQITPQAAEPATDTGDGTTRQELEAQLAQAEAQAAEYLDNWRRTTAELSNARKRMQREQAEYQANASARVLAKLLSVLDDMDRAFEVLPPEGDNEDWVNGFRMIQRKIHNILESEGATAIQTQGQKFDPQLHHAVSHEEYPGLQEGDIIGEVGRGYKLGDRVLRPALVRVAKG